MAYSEQVAHRLRAAIGSLPVVHERKMFGGIAFMVNGNMCMGVLDDKLVLRLDVEKAGEALKKPHTEPMTFTGKVMKTMVYVLPKGYESDKDFGAWVKLVMDYALTLKAN